MLLKTHRIVTVAAATDILAHTHQPAGMYALLVVVAVGAALPDIDSNSSFLGRHLPFISRHLRHRGITHSVYAGIAMALWAYFSGNITVMALAFGYVMHLIEDGFSAAGLDWFMTGHPIVMPINYLVGGKFETVMRITAWIATILIILCAFGEWSVSPYRG